MRAVLFLVVAVVAFASGCASSRTTGAAIDGFCADASEADSSAGAFHYGGIAACKNEVESYNWTNPGPYANVQWSGVAVTGSFGLKVHDAAGREVYTTTIDATTVASEQSRTQAGVPSLPLAGAWRIELDFREFSGTMELQISGPP